MRPLIKRSPTGHLYAVPSTPRRPAPPVRPQPTSDTPSRSKPALPQQGRHMGKAKLTDEEVRAIRAEFASGEWSRKDLAYIYRVSGGAINNVLNGRSYTHITRGRSWEHATDDATETTPGEQD